MITTGSFAMMILEYAGRESRGISSARFERRKWPTEKLKGCKAWQQVGVHGVIRGVGF